MNSKIIKKIDDLQQLVKKNQKGLVLVIVMAFMALMLLSTVSLSVMIQRDIRLIRGIKEKEQARYAAEAGISHALAKLKSQEISILSPTDFTGSLDTGAYSVTFSTAGGRILITSVGTVSGVSRTVTAEIAGNMPTALNYFSGAGNDIKINALVAGASITGDIHANNNVYLKAGPIVAWLFITGNVSATGIVKEGKRHDQGSLDMWDNHVVINGDADDTAYVEEGADRITFPVFDYAKYKQAAIDSGDYYSSDTTFDSETLTPANGIVYVEGEALFRGTCVLNGGVIADAIEVRGGGGRLEQNKTGHNRNVVIAKNGDVRIRGRLSTEEALVYAAQDIKSLQVLAVLEVNGLMLAKRDIDMWNVITLIDYQYVPIVPADMLGAEGEETFDLISWNK